MGKERYDWKAIQAFYDQGHTREQVAQEFGIAVGSFHKATKRGSFVARAPMEAQTGATQSPNSRGLPIDLDRINALADAYSRGASWRDLVQKLAFTQKEFRYARDNRYLIPRSLADAARNARSKGRSCVPMSVEARAALSERQSLNNSGGRCKWFWVGDQHVQGTWERDAGIKLTQLGIEWRKCAGKADIITYVLDGKTRRYTPDFYLPVFDLYLEFKGYWWGNDRAKMDAVLAQHPEKNIAIIEKHQYEALFAEETDINVHDIFRQS